MEQAGQQNGGGGRQAERLGQEIGQAQGEGRHHDISEIVDDEVEPLAAEARQDGLDVDRARERTVDRIDEERDAQPDEHRLHVAFMRRSERKKREHRARGGEHMHRYGADQSDHRQLTWVGPLPPRVSDVPSSLVRIMI